MHTKNEASLTPWIEAEWERQESALRQLRSSRSGTPSAPDADKSYMLLLAAIGDDDLPPPNDLATRIAAVLEAHAKARRQVRTFRRRTLMASGMAIAALMIVACMQLRGWELSLLGQDLEMIAYRLGWAGLPLVAVLLAVLPVRPNSKRCLDGHSPIFPLDR